MGLLLWWRPFRTEDIETLTDLSAAGKLVPAIDHRYPLGDVVDALRHVDQGHPSGKVVLTM
jgi:NADPH:quinone reductase-like Zn-dependent oxidoreductase